MELNNTADTNQLTEQILTRETVFPGVIINLEHWKVTLPNGKEAMREVACHIGAAAVVAIDDDDNLLLVRQHRVAVERITREIPAGKLDSRDEDPFECAKRELSEETGMTAESWEKLTCLETTPGFCNERIHVYLARGLKQGETHPDEDEFVDVIRMPVKEAVAAVMRGEIRDSKTVCGILMASQKLGL
ncbi:MAG: NUDIX hydrolase [Clostridia bacterium]|nr:NUDIX hydrolase [Clostridia bacterium]